MTPSDLQSYNLILEKVPSDENINNNWLKNNSMNLIILSMMLMLFSGIGGAFYLIRKSEI